MVICSDNSFLFSLYGNDANSPSATSWLRETGEPIRISSLNDLELRNTLRFAESRRLLPPGASTNYLTFFETSLRAGRLILTNCNLSDVVLEAGRLSKRCTLSHGHSTFPLLHIAAAKIIGATHFLTFEPSLKRLAENEGLSVPF